MKIKGSKASMYQYQLNASFIILIMDLGKISQFGVSYLLGKELSLVFMTLK
jgi:hypothetical protein